MGVRARRMAIPAPQDIRKGHGRFAQASRRVAELEAALSDKTRREATLQVQTAPPLPCAARRCVSTPRGAAARRLPIAKRGDR